MDLQPSQTARSPLPRRFRVGDWLVEPTANRLSRGDEVRRVEPKVMEVLVCMAERAGETVSRDAFMEQVWTGTIVTDDVLARCISELRKALGDKARRPEYVETIRKRGYALIAPVEAVPEPGARRRAPDRGVAERAAAAYGAGDGSAAGLATPRVSPAEARERLARRRRRTSLRTAAALGAVAGLIAVSAAVSFRIFGDRLRPLPAVPITSFPGEERDPALAPDGETIAFAWSGADGARDRFDVYVQSVEAGATPTRLTSAPVDEHSPAWSPDGERLAYARCAADGCAVHVVDRTGGDARLLADLGRFQMRDLVWSPDGTTLAFAGRNAGAGAFSLHLLPLDGDDPKRLTSPPATYPGDLDPAWSPDGATLAFVRTSLDGRQDVCVVAADGGEVTRLAREQKGVTGLDWAGPREIVYAANRDGAAGLWRIGVEGGSPRWVALGADGGEVSEPSVARRGRGIAFARRLVRTEIAEVRGGQTRAVVSSTREDSHPSLSPDGTRLAFVSTRSGSHEVWVARADGSGAQRLTEFAGPRVSTPRWSPDGAEVVFSARRGGHADIFAVDLQGILRPLTESAADEVAPSWSADGAYVYFASTRATGRPAAGTTEATTWQIFRMPAAGGDAEPVTRYGGVAAMETADGALLVVRPDREGLWRLPPGPDGLPRDNNITRIPAKLAPADWANWAVDGGWVYLLERRLDGRADLVRVDASVSGPRETLATLSGIPDQPGLAVARGGGRILLTQVERGDSDIVLVADFR